MNPISPGVYYPPSSCGVPLTVLSVAARVIRGLKPNLSTSDVQVSYPLQCDVSV